MKIHQPVSEKSNDKAPSSWNTLCMLGSTGKLYERMTLNRVHSDLEDPWHEGISEMQYGFYAGRNTLDAVQEVQKRVDRAFSMKPKGGFGAVVILAQRSVGGPTIWNIDYN